MANDITPQQLFSEYGVLNDLRPADGLSGDRRSLTTTDAISAVLEEAFTPDAIGSKTVFGAVVMASDLSDQPVVANPLENLDYVSRQLELANNPKLTGDAVYYKYRVYVHETDPRVVIPIEELLKGDIKNLKIQGLSLADRVQTLPEASLSLESAPRTQVAIEPGTLVGVIYANEERYLNPQIVKIYGKIFDINFTNSSIKLAHKFGSRTTLGRQRGTSTNLKPSTSARVAAAKQKAENLKQLRRQIFESKGNETLTAPSGYTFSASVARGGLPGPFKKKKNRSWTSDAILDRSIQKQLKTKFMPEIKAMLKRLGMPLVTFEKILAKECGIFDPYAINRNTAATGLIQFMPEDSKAATAKRLGTTVEKLLTMGPKQQLTYVEKYFNRLKGNKTISSANKGVDWYFLVFYPKAVGKPDSYVIGSAYTAEVNPGYADPLPPDGRITRRRVVARWLGKT